MCLIKLRNSLNEELEVSLSDFVSDKEKDIILRPSKYDKLTYDITVEELNYRLHNRFDANFFVDNKNSIVLVYKVNNFESYIELF